MVTTWTWFGSVSLQNVCNQSFVFLKWHLTKFISLSCSPKAQPYRPEVFFGNFRNLSKLNNCMQTTLNGYWNPWALFFQKWQTLMQDHATHIYLSDVFEVCAMFTLGNTHFIRQEKKNPHKEVLWKLLQDMEANVNQQHGFFCFAHFFPINNLKKFKSFPRTVSHWKR